MRPVLVACYFVAKKERDGQYDRLARVLAYTAAQHCPGWEARIAHITPTLKAPSTGNPSHAWNSAKLQYWAASVQAMADGTPLVLIDADTMILRPLDALWARPFDLAYTTRERTRLPLNGGVVALRVSPAMKAAIARWQAMDEAMLTTGTLHAKYHAKYAGMNQASFGYMLEEGGFAGLSVLPIPCREWNCCEWETFRPEVTRVVHVKSRLRRAVFQKTGGDEDIAGLVAQWHTLEAEAIKPERDAPVPDEDRHVTPDELDDRMVRPETLETPEIPPLSRRQRRDRPEMGDPQ